MSGGALVRPSRSVLELAGEEEFARLQGELLAPDSVPVLQGAIRHVTNLLDAGTVDRRGALKQLAELQRRLLDRPYEPELAGWGHAQYHGCRRVDVPERLQREVVLDAGAVGECYEEAARFAVRHADQPVTVVAGVCWELGLPWPHCWCELAELDAVWDPATSLYYQRGDFYRVLGVMPLATWTPAEAAGLLADGRGFAPMHATMDDLAGRLLAEVERAAPGFGRWLEGMLAADRAFAGAYRRYASVSPLMTVQVHLWLAARTGWREHEPGVDGPFPYPLHPFPVLRVAGIVWTAEAGATGKEGGA